MDRHLHEELEKVNELILKMAAFVEESIHNSAEALKKQDAALARSVLDEDKRIDDIELVIEKKLIDILALHQPMAKDLRFITTGMKLNAELERIGDLSCNVAQRVLELSDKPVLKPLVEIPALFEIAKKMVKGAIDSFVKNDTKLAKEVILADAEADNLRNSIQEELVSNYMGKDKSSTDRAVPLLLIARHLERTCDHATYIAEDVIYMVQARIVKHHYDEIYL